MTDGINDNSKKLSRELDLLEQRIDFSQRRIQNIGQNKNNKKI